MIAMTQTGTHPSPHPTQSADDLKQITGIGPAIERRLNAGEIFTFAQLAGSSLDELAALFVDVPGHSRERLAEKDWIGQARSRTAAADSIPLESENDDLDFHQRQRYASFTVELLVEADRKIRRTRVYNIQAQQEVSWAGWDPLRLMGFFAESGNLNLAELPSVGPSEPLVDAAPEAVFEPPAAHHFPSGALIVHEAMILVAGHPAWDLPAGQPFQIHLDLELDGVELPGDTIAEYAVTVDAKRVGSGATIRLGSVNGSLAGSSRFAADVNVAGLLAGFYRPDAFVSLTLVDGGANQLKTFRAVREGQSFVVF